LRVRRQTDLFRKRKVLLIFIILLCWAGGFTYFFRDILFWEKTTIQEGTAAQRSEFERIKNEKRLELAQRLRAVMDNEQNVTAQQEIATGGAASEVTPEEVGGGAVEKEIIAGWTSIFDPWGRQVTRFRSAATAAGWVAIPSRASLAGNNWVFSADFGREAQLANGLWSPGDSVGLWLTASGNTPSGASLIAWKENVPVNWISIESQRKKNEVILAPIHAQPPFIVCSIPRDINEIGVLVQNNSVVGWTFGQWLTNGFLWNGQPGTELTPQISVQSFYNDTFSGGREEKFASALALEETGRAEERLQGFIDGFHLEPKLNLVDTPYYLHPDEIIKQIRILASQLIHSGKGASVAESLDAETLRNIGDISLFMDIIPAITATRGYEAAILDIETAGRAIVDSLQINVPALNDLHATLYQEWLQSLVTVGAVDEGEQVFEKAKTFYPEDPYLHLLGVELEILAGNWQRAEELLYSREYPPFLQDRFQLLAKRISEMKGEQGKIVVRFQAGSSRVPVAAAINEILYQDFIVDTGASLVTIPSATAEALRMAVVAGVHGGQQMVSTAGGAVAADEVLIDALEIDGWIEYNVRALVMDIPGQPGVGLLGLNYLSRFKMDLNTSDGVLLLSPK
jgi:clan AA aspartic protease (TIGR02281 family)